MYQYLDHPSEAYVQVDSEKIEGIFLDAASALFELMTDTSKLRSTTRFSMELESPDRSTLLVDWLNRLILMHEVEHVFLRDFHVLITQDDNWRLSAEVSGEQIQPEHERRMQAKSATFGNLEWTETTAGYTVKFVIDI